MPSPPPLEETVSADLSVNLQQLSERFTLTPDLIVRRFQILLTKSQAALVFLDGLTDKNAVTNHILAPLMNPLKDGEANTGELPISISNVQSSRQWTDIEMSILKGKSVLFIDGSSDVTIMDTQGWPQRAIEDPQLEAAIKGAHQGFVETGAQNIAMIRRYLSNRELKIKNHLVGRRGSTAITLLYLADVANPKVLQELENRLEQLNMDAIHSSGELAEWIEDEPFSPFPQAISTERPDSAASHINQGRIAVVIDGSPGVLIVPATFTSFFQSIDDYGTRWMIASFLRMLRVIATLFALCLPSFYISLVSFNYDLLPIKLLITIGNSRAGVPFPPILEAVMMEITLEMMREAGVRLPAPIGQTVGIVGGIVIGQTAVQAGIVSNIMVVIVSFTAISSFIIPNHDMGAAIRLIRFPMMLLAYLYGIVGIVVGMMILLAHLISMKSMGVPYGSPFAPVRFSDWKDTLVRLPIWKMNDRPQSVKPAQLKRQGERPEGGKGNQ